MSEKSLLNDLCRYVPGAECLVELGRRPGGLGRDVTWD